MFMMLPDCIIELLVWTTLRLAFIGLISQLFLIFIYTPLRLMCRRMLWRIWGTPHWEEDPPQSMFGVLVDVSGSMKSAFALDRSKDASVERVHAIITTTLKIVKAEVNNHNRSDKIFVSAFGLNVRIACAKPSLLQGCWLEIERVDDVDTCDLIALLTLIAGPEKLRGLEPHDALIQLAIDHGAAHAERWIREYLNKEEARDLFKVLCFDEDLVLGMIQKIPPVSVSIVSGVGNYIPGGRSVEEFAIHRSEAYRYAQELVRSKDKIINIKQKLKSIEHSFPESVSRVSQLLDDLNLREDSDLNLRDDYSGPSSSNSSSLHSRIKELIDPIRPYIFGRTPMCKAIRSASQLFQSSRAKSKVFFILSDGNSTDGNPLHLVGALQDSNVIRVSCYLTDEHIPNQRCLMDKAPSYWPWCDGRRTLFDMSSTVRNIDPPVSFLLDLDNGWTLPPSGESRLFVQANSLDVVDELCKVVVAQLTNPCDGLQNSNKTNKQSEKDAYRIEAIKKAKNLATSFPSINSLPFECPRCRRISSVKEFEGDLIEANCPKCEHKFRPTNDDLVKSLYLRNV